MTWYEEHLIHPDEWQKRYKEMPQKCKDIVDTDKWVLGPTGIGHCEKLGWFICGSGQGPFMIWSEKPYTHHIREG